MEKNKMSVRVSYKKQFVFWILLIVVVLAIVEVGLRIYYYDNPNFCSMLQSDAYENLPNDIKNKICLDAINIVWNYYPVEYIQPNQNLYTIHINNDGFRGPEITKDKPYDTYRIFVVGGSTTFGWGSTSDETTIPGYLQQDFDNAHLNYKIQVINAGVGGAYSLVETNYVKNKLLAYHPDMIIVYDGINDLVTSSRGLNHIQITESLTDKLIGLDKKYLSFYKTPQILQLIINGIKSKTQSQTMQILDTISVEQRSTVWKNNWIDICDLGEKDGFDTVVTLQPFLGTGNLTMTKYEYNLFLKINSPATLKSYQLYIDQLDELNNHCKKTADLRSAFDGISGPIFWDQDHTTDEGNKIIAKNLFQMTMSILKQKGIK